MIDVLMLMKRNLWLPHYKVVHLDFMTSVLFLCIAAPQLCFSPKDGCKKGPTHSISPTASDDLHRQTVQLLGSLGICHTANAAFGRRNSGSGTLRSCFHGWWFLHHFPKGWMDCPFGQPFLYATALWH